MPRSTELTQRMPAILEDARQRIMAGESLEAIALSHNITERTLHTWCSALGPKYEEVQQAWIDSMLFDAVDAIKNVEAPTDRESVLISNFHLTRARHEWDRATFYAERRDKRYQIKQEQQVTVLPVFTMILDQGGVNVHRLGQGGDCGDIYQSAQTLPNVDNASAQSQLTVDSVPNTENASSDENVTKVPNPPSQSEG